MATTILCDKNVAAFRNTKGEVFYLIFSQTYAKNDHPHRPDWTCLAFGTFEEVMENVFLSAAACASGMLKSRNGDIKPENHIQSWLRAFDNPYQFTVEQEFVLQVSEKWRSTIPTSLWREAAAALTAIGRQDVVHELSKEGGTVRVSLAKDCDVLRALYGTKAPIAAWRLFDVGDCRTTYDASLAPHRVVQSDTSTIALPQFLKYSTNRYLMKEADKPWRSPYWTRSVFDQFILDQAYQAEMKAPRSSVRLIAQYRERMTSAPVIPSGTKVTVTIAPANVAICCIEDAKRLAKALRIPEEAHSFTLEFDRLPDDEAWRIFDLHENQLVWDVPTSPSLSEPQESSLTQADLVF